MSERAEQAMLLKWADAQTSRWPELGLLFAIPNAGGFSGGFKSNVVRVTNLRREGVKKGVPDLCLPVPRGPYHGLYIELKAKGGRVKPEQRAWLAALRDQGYAAHLCVGYEDAQSVLTDYLTLKPREAAA